MTLPRSITCGLPCCLALLAGCNLPVTLDKADRPVPADQIADFAVLYGMYCAGCHGADGKLGPAPPLNDPVFLSIVPDDALLQLVDAGRPGTPMPGFSQERGGPLTPKQVRAVAEGIKPKWTRTDSASSKSSIDLPAYAFAAAADTAAAAARGETLFAAACAKCHGREGGGDGAGRLNDPDFLALASNQMLRRIIITGRPDLGMPDFATVDGRGHDFRPLSSADIDDLVALLAEWRGAGGQREARGPNEAGRKPDAEQRR